MNRAILIGDGQLELFRTLDDLAHYIEPPEAETGAYKAFTEDGKRWHFSVIEEPVRKLGKGITIKTVIPVQDSSYSVNDLKLEMTDFFRRCGITYIESSSENCFDFVQSKLGFSS
jgi:hypothetical protein